MNEGIRAREVRLIGEAGEQLGIVSLAEALRIARERNTDVVEVAPTANPPVCRLLDYGKFKYEQTKKEREARKHQKVILLKEVRFRPKIDPHDVDFKTRQAQRFLSEGDKVKLSVMFRGREISHPELGREILNRVLNALKDVATVEKPMSLEGKNMTVVLAALPSKAVKEPSKATREAETVKVGKEA